MYCTIVSSNDRVYSSVIIYVSRRQAARDPGVLKVGSRVRRHIYEIPARVSRQEHGFPVMEVWKCQLNGIHIVPLRDDEVLPTVIVIVEKSHAPTGVRKTDSG